MTEVINYNLYEGHMGGYYAVDASVDEFFEDDLMEINELDYSSDNCLDCDGSDSDCYSCGYYDPFYCGQCGDSDYLIGTFSYAGDLSKDNPDYQEFLYKQAKILGED